MSRGLVLKNCRLYDPINEVNGELVDLCISNGRVVETVTGRAREIDVKGRVVMPGGVDLHSHIAGSKMNLARSMCPEDHRGDPIPKTRVTRSGVGHTLPSSFALGYRYSIMGYTTVVEPAVTPIKALSLWEEFADIPNLNLAHLSMFGNSMIALHYLEEHDIRGLAGYISWILKNTGCYGVKIVNPGGTYAWSYGMNIRELDTEIPDWSLTPRDILRGFCEAVESLGLPHPIHLHPNNLGKVGNVETTIAQLEALRGMRGHNKRRHIIHLAHMSFDCLGVKENADPLWKNVASGGIEFAEYANKHDHFTTDLGQITFGPATTMTGDGPFQFSLYQLTHGKWTNVTVDAELPGGAGIVPYYYRERSPANSIQWAIPLEFALSIKDVWRCVLTTDHPNAGPFTKYPLVISWLMSKKQRALWLERVHPIARERSGLSDIDREWNLYDVAISTRAAPARILGLDERKGHLGIGADADIAVYDIDPIKTDLSSHPDKIVKAFQTAFLTILGGEFVSKRGKTTRHDHGVVLSIDPHLSNDALREINRDVTDLISRYYSHSPANYPVPDRYRSDYEQKMGLDVSPVLH